MSIPAELIALVASDEEIKARVRKLVIHALDEAEYTLAHGSPAYKNQLIKAAVPALMRTLADQQDNPEIVALRDAVSTLKTQFNDYAIAPHSVTQEPAVVDEPS